MTGIISCDAQLLALSPPIKSQTEVDSRSAFDRHPLVDSAPTINMAALLDPFLDEDLLHQALSLLLGRENEGDGDTRRSSHEPCVGEPLYFDDWTAPSSTEPEAVLHPRTTLPRSDVASRLDLMASNVVLRPRSKHKAEIERLRLQARHLEERLEVIRGRRGGSTIEEDSNVGVGWSAVAVSERAELRTSQAENQRLKELLSEHKRMFRLLRRLMCKHSKAIMKETYRRSSPPRSSLPEMAPSIKDPGIFAQLLNSLEEIQAHTQSAFVTQHVHNFPHSGRDIQTELNGGVGVVIRIIDTRIFPFSYDTVAAAVWRQSFGLDGINPTQWNDIGRNTFQTQMNTHADIGAYAGNVQGKIAMRRIDSADRVTVLRVGRFVCGDPGAQPIRNYQWTVVTKPLVQEIDAESACQLMTCDISFHTISAAEELDRAARAAHFSGRIEAFVDVSKHRLDRAHEAVDKILFPGRSS